MSWRSSTQTRPAFGGPCCRTRWQRPTSACTLQKNKALIPGFPAGALHPAVAACGIPQVHGQLELLGNVVDGEYVADLVANPGVPPQTWARLEAAERLASTLQDLMRRPLGNPFEKSCVGHA